MYVCESWTIKKAEHQRTDAFELWCWRRLLGVSWTAKRSNQSIRKEISPEYSLEGLMLAGGQCEELHPWQRSSGRRLGIRKGMIKPQETPCSRASTPKTRVCLLYLCSHLHLWLSGGLSPITISLGEGVNLQLQLIKIPGHDECFNLQTPLKVL